MKFVRFLSFLLLIIPTVVFGAKDSDFQTAAKLLTAAKNGDTQTIQKLISSGADINYTDTTGMSLVCTALMNNDKKSVQVLQMYGADASQCDSQIKKYKKNLNKSLNGEENGFFSGLSSSHILALSAGGVALVAGGLALFTDVFKFGNKNGGSSSGNRPHHDDDDPTGDGTKAFTIPYGPAMMDKTAEESKYLDNLKWYGRDSTSEVNAKNYKSLTDSEGIQNYLWIMHGYSPLARYYLGQKTLRKTSNENNVPYELYDKDGVAIYKLDKDHVVQGGEPVNIALITKNGINTGDENSSLYEYDETLGKWDYLLYSVKNGSSIENASIDKIFSKYYNNKVSLTENKDVKFEEDNSTIKLGGEDIEFVDFFDLSGNNSAVHNEAATDIDNLLAKIIVGKTSAAEDPFMGFMPNGQLTVFRTGSKNENGSYMNYKALSNAFELSSSSLSSSGNVGARSLVNVIANAFVIPELKTRDVATILDVISADDTEKQFLNLISKYYDDDNVDDVNKNTNKAYADNFFSSFGKQKDDPMVVFSTGSVLLDDSNRTSSVQAEFENAAPLVFGNVKNYPLEHLFMSVVPVNTITKDKNISNDYSVTGIQVAQWEDVSTQEKYKGRICGIAGVGTNDVDPWCFASAGLTEELAVSAAAGAVGSLKSAFPYMSNKDLFVLMALTADGPYLDLGKGNTDSASAKAELMEHLQNMYILPDDYAYMVEKGTKDYMEAFKEVFGYGLINLERATTPGKSVYYYKTGKIVSDSGNAYWRASTNTALKSSNVLGLNGVSVKSSYYDILSSVDGSLTLPRIWTNEFTLGTVDKHGLYMGDVLGEFNVDTKSNQSTKVGNVEIDMALSPRAYVDNMNGLDNLNIKFTTDTVDVSAGYQRYLTNGESRFTGRANSVLSLASRAIKSDATYKNGNWSFGASAFSGSITDETLLENDPTISAQFEPGRLGFVNGGAADVSYLNDQFSLNMSVGTMHETNTLLGSYSDGLLSLGNGDTVYVDTVAEYKPFENVKLSLRGTFANTKANSYAGLVSDVTNIQSNSFALGADLGDFSFTASLPLAAVKGNIFYDYADYSVIETDTGSYDLVINDAHREALSLVPKNREMRFNASYKHSLGDFTDAGIGFIYRVNPNNISQFGNESIFMLKIHHRLGI